MPREVGEFARGHPVVMGGIGMGFDSKAHSRIIHSTKVHQWPLVLLVLKTEI